MPMQRMSDIEFGRLSFVVYRLSLVFGRWLSTLSTYGADLIRKPHTIDPQGWC